MANLPQRLKVIVPGLVLGSIIALCFATVLAPDHVDLRERVVVWATVMLGPVTETIRGSVMLSPWVNRFGWLGLALISAHPIRPHWATGLLTFIGLKLWFFAGIIAAAIRLWGS
jgi:hypothetical protein